MSTGRNDPCPCGSGKKYKKCCLSQTEVISLEAARTDRVYRDLWEKLSKHMASPATADDIGDGYARFFAPGPGEGEEPDPQADEAALDWIAFAYRTTGDGDTLCGRYATRGRDLTDQERALLHEWAASAPGFFRVQEVTARELHLNRLPDGQGFRVRASGMGLKAGDLVSAWLLPVFSTYVFGYSVGEIPTEAADSLTHLLEVEMELLRRQRPAATWDELYREFWPRLIDALALAVVYGADASRILPPPCPSVGWDGKEPPEVDGEGEEVARLVQQAIELGSELLLGGETAGALRLWWDGALALRPRVVRPEGWAAGVVYLYRRDIMDDPVTQAEVAEQLGVSVATVGSRSRELASALAVTRLDPRYVDLLDPLFRAAWRLRCLRACEAGESNPREPEPEPAALDQALRSLERMWNEPGRAAPRSGPRS